MGYTELARFDITGTMLRFSVPRFVIQDILAHSRCPQDLLNIPTFMLEKLITVIEGDPEPLEDDECTPFLILVPPTIEYGSSRKGYIDSNTIETRQAIVLKQNT